VGYSIRLETEEHRGDHAADVTVCFEPVVGESVGDLIERIARTRYGGESLLVTDRLVLQTIAKAE